MVAQQIGSLCEDDVFKPEWSCEPTVFKVNERIKSSVSDGEWMVFAVVATGLERDAI